MFSFAHATSSGKKIADAAIMTIPGQVYGIDVIPPNSGQVLVTIYDSEDSSVSGKLILAELHVDAGMPTLNHEWVRPIIANRGIYCTLVHDGGSAASYIVRYGLGT